MWCTIVFHCTLFNWPLKAGGGICLCVNIVVDLVVTGKVSEMYQFSCVFPLQLGAPPFSRYPKTPSPHRTRLPSLSPCLSSLAFLSPPPPFLHPSLPCSSQPVSDFLQPPCRRCPCLHMLFCNMWHMWFSVFMLPHECKYDSAVVKNCNE